MHTGSTITGGFAADKARSRSRVCDGWGEPRGLIVPSDAGDF
ncbi:MAG: hypothetical protein V7637_5660 [Mycobacteriales bacterium]